MKITTEITPTAARAIADYVRANGGAEHCTHGALDFPTLARMLLEDVALAWTRPGSWEGNYMLQLLHGHGYFGPEAGPELRVDVDSTITDRAGTRRL
jgi:hypothetical protein